MTQRKQLSAQSAIWTVTQTPTYTSFVSNTVGNDAQNFSPTDSLIRDIVLQKTDSTITYVYVYDKIGPTPADTPRFRFIVKDTMPVNLFANARFFEGISIRATSDLNGTTDPVANTLFVNITYSNTY